MEDGKIFKGWCIVEQLGYKRLIGFVKEEEIASIRFLRVDVPGEGETIQATQWVHPNTVYALTPITEEYARQYAPHAQFHQPAALTLRDDFADEYPEEEPE